MVHVEEKNCGYFPIMVKSDLCHLKEKKKVENKNYKEC
ncbi:hypothetical protein H311_04088, partial [Anncaliia algerae PRA109]